MVKSDEHMARVKDRLMYEQQQIEEADERWVYEKRGRRGGAARGWDMGEGRLPVAFGGLGGGMGARGASGNDPKRAC
jgi:hypothetical protein